MKTRHSVALGVGFAGGVALGLVVWSRQTQRSRRDLFHPSPLRRLAALGYLRGQRNIRTVRILRDYIEWEQHPRLRRRARQLLNRMETSLA